LLLPPSPPPSAPAPSLPFLHTPLSCSAPLPPLPSFLSPLSAPLSAPLSGAPPLANTRRTWRN
jgi:hypothetical protein